MQVMKQHWGKLGRVSERSLWAKCCLCLAWDRTDCPARRPRR